MKWWDSIANLQVFKALRMKRGAVITVENTDGTTTDVDLAELAALDSIGAADLQKIDGITNGTQAAGKAVVADANVNTGISKVTQLHIGASGSETQVTATAAELNYNDITTLGTGAASKSVVLDAGEDYVWPATGILTYGVLKDPAGSTLGATVAEIDRVADVSVRVVNTTATTLSITQATHEGKLVTVNSAAPIAITMPAAAGTGGKYTFVVGTAATATPHTVKVANTTDIFAGVSLVAQTDTTQVNGFLTTATDDTITLNGTTSGGKKGDRIEIVDVASGVFAVTMWAGADGTVATPFSATV